MRTSGTFQAVYEAAKSYAQGNDMYGGCPINPVVRREGDKWMLESALEPTTGDFEISLEAFDSYFYESYKTDFVPTASDVADFVEIHHENSLRNTLDLERETDQN